MGNRLHYTERPLRTMANWIATEIEITSNREVLEVIAKAINDCNDTPSPDNITMTNWVGFIFDRLHINTKRWASTRTFWHHAHFNQHGHLVFCEESAWEKSKCAEALKQKFPQEISGINYK